MTKAGFGMGAQVAALQASVRGERIYRRYREITRYRWYVLMPSGASPARAESTRKEAATKVATDQSIE